MMDSSWFADVEHLPPSELFSIESQYTHDDFDRKLNFAFPCYRDEYGNPWVFPVVRVAETVLANDSSLSKEYLHPLGYETLNQSAVSLLLGHQSRARLESRAFAIQTMSATGATRIGAEFLAGTLGMTTVYFPEQTLEDLGSVFLSAGFKELRELRYFDYYSLSLDIEYLLKDLENAQAGAVVFLQVSGHNPTGCDPDSSEWEKIADIIASKQLFPFFYSPFQGFATGDVHQDVEVVRMFETRGLEFFCSQSFAWNFGLYNERSGCLSIVAKHAQHVNPIRSHLLKIAGNMYWAPPSHGSRIVAFILEDKILSEEWKASIAGIAARLKQMRTYLREELERLGAPGSWAHITNQVGLFCFIGLNQIQVEYLKKQYHIYMLSNGRLNVSGLNMDNVEYVARAIYETMGVIPSSYVMSVAM
ncbi:hypothetical protein HUJ04_004305 [Dendroctonus ponderosae]